MNCDHIIFGRYSTIMIIVILCYSIQLLNVQQVEGSEWYETTERKTYDRFGIISYIRDEGLIENYFPSTLNASGKHIQYLNFSDLNLDYSNYQQPYEKYVLNKSEVEGLIGIINKIPQNQEAPIIVQTIGPIINAYSFDPNTGLIVGTVFSALFGTAKENAIKANILKLLLEEGGCFKHYYVLRTSENVPTKTYLLDICTYCVNIGANGTREILIYSSSIPTDLALRAIEGTDDNNVLRFEEDLNGQWKYFYHEKGTDNQSESEIFTKVKECEEFVYLYSEKSENIGYTYFRIGKKDISFYSCISETLEDEDSIAGIAWELRFYPEINFVAPRDKYITIIFPQTPKRFSVLKK